MYLLIDKVFKKYHHFAVKSLDQETWWSEQVQMSMSFKNPTFDIINRVTSPFI